MDTNLRKLWEIVKESVDWCAAVYVVAKSWTRPSAWKTTNLPLGFPWWPSGKEYICQAGDMGSIPELGRFPGKGNGNPLQYSCLGKPMDRGVWWVSQWGRKRVRHNLTTKQQPSSALYSLPIAFHLSWFQLKIRVKVKLFVSCKLAASFFEVLILSTSRPKWFMKEFLPNIKWKAH